MAFYVAIIMKIHIEPLVNLYIARSFISLVNIYIMSLIDEGKI